MKQKKTGSHSQLFLIETIANLEGLKIMNNKTKTKHRTLTNNGSSNKE